MPAATTPPPPAARATDDLDDLFNYDVAEDDVFRDFVPNMDAPPQPKTNGNAETPADLGLEEIQVAKARKPVAKLDEGRLLSQAGIPKLRRITKERLKFKGKGHEYSDVARLLNLYQLWLDDLFPRTTFADGLTIIEKLGHTRRMQVMRQQWIKDGQPIERREDHEKQPSSPTIVDAAPTVQSKEKTNETTKKSATWQSSGKNESLFISDDEGNGPPDDDELDALLAEHTSNGPPRVPSKIAPERDEFEDEMDALLDMEDPFARRAPVGAPSNPITVPERDEFGDEMDALLDMEDPFARRAHVGAPSNPMSVPERDEFEDEMEALADIDDSFVRRAPIEHASNLKPVPQQEGTEAMVVIDDDLNQEASMEPKATVRPIYEQKEDEQDELDAILAKDAGNGSAGPPSTAESVPERGSLEDKMEGMTDFQEPVNGQASTGTPSPVKPIPERIEIEMDELDELLTEDAERLSMRGTSIPKEVAIVPVSGPAADEMEGMVAAGDAL